MNDHEGAQNGEQTHTIMHDGENPDAWIMADNAVDPKERA
jgi:hypothetical protein